MALLVGGIAFLAGCTHGNNVIENIGGDDDDDTIDDDTSGDDTETEYLPHDHDNDLYESCNDYLHDDYLRNLCLQQIQTQEDCDDYDPDINPGAFEIPVDSIDQNCDGADIDMSINSCLNDGYYLYFPSRFEEPRTIPLNIFYIVDVDGTRYETEHTMEELLDAANPFFTDINLSFVIGYETEVSRLSDEGDITSSELSEIKETYAIDEELNVFVHNPTSEIPPSCGNRIMTISYLTIEALELSYTFTHESGHCMGLKHTHEGEGEELVDGSNCLDVGDKICDTPADPGPAAAGSIDNENACEVDWDTCEIISCGTDENGDTYNPDVHNFMSYYSVCRESFTENQRQVMYCDYLLDGYE